MSKKNRNRIRQSWCDISPSSGPAIFNTVFSKLLIVVTLLVVFSANGLSQAEANPIIVPPSLKNTEGNTNNCIPFTCDIVLGPYQQIYSSSLFVGDILIGGIAFRPDWLSGGEINSLFSNALVQLGTTSEVPDTGAGLVTGNGMTTVYSGPLTLSSSFTGPAGGPMDFDMVINFTNPFYYDVSEGNLLFDFQNLGTATYLVLGFLDATNVSGDGISRRYAGSGSSKLALVTQFNVVPEPATMLLLSTGLVGVAGAARRRKKNQA